MTTIANFADHKNKPNDALNLVTSLKLETRWERLHRVTRTVRRSWHRDPTRSMAADEDVPSRQMIRNPHSAMGFHQKCLILVSDGGQFLFLHLSLARLAAEIKLKEGITVTWGRSSSLYACEGRYCISETAVSLAWWKERIPGQGGTMAETNIMKKSSFVWIVDVYTLEEGTYVHDGWFLARVFTLRISVRRHLLRDLVINIFVPWSWHPFGIVWCWCEDGFSGDLGALWSISCKCYLQMKGFFQRFSP